MQNRPGIVDIDGWYEFELIFRENHARVFQFDIMRNKTGPDVYNRFF